VQPVAGGIRFSGEWEWVIVVNTQKSHQIAAVERLEKAASQFAEAIREIPRPSDTPDLLDSLGAVQTTLEGVYAALATWHGAVVTGVHHGGERERGDPGNPGWVRADIALREAAQYSSDAAAALARAHKANDVALWFDELRDAGER